MNFIVLIESPPYSSLDLACHSQLDGLRCGSWWSREGNSAGAQFRNLKAQTVMIGLELLHAFLHIPFVSRAWKGKDLPISVKISSTISLTCLLSMGPYILAQMDDLRGSFDPLFLPR